MQLGKASLKKNVFFRALPEFFGPLFRSAFLVQNSVYWARSALLHGIIAYYTELILQIILS